MNPIQQLKEDYERRAENAKQMSDDHRRACDQDVIAIERIDTKAVLYRDFARELGKLIPKPVEAEQCRICGSTEGMSREDELCDGCFTNH